MSARTAPVAGSAAPVPSPLNGRCVGGAHGPHGRRSVCGSSRAAACDANGGQRRCRRHAARAALAATAHVVARAGAGGSAVGGCHGWPLLLPRRRPPRAPVADSWCAAAVGIGASCGQPPTTRRGGGRRTPWPPRRGPLWHLAQHLRLFDTTPLSPTLPSPQHHCPRPLFASVLLPPGPAASIRHRHAAPAPSAWTSGPCRARRAADAADAVDAPTPAAAVDTSSGAAAPAAAGRPRRASSRARPSSSARSCPSSACRPMRGGWRWPPLCGCSLRKRR